MIIVCPTCSTRLQIDDEKSSSPFSVRCPKCNNAVSQGNTSAGSEQGALSIGTSPSTGRVRFEPNVAPAYQVAPAPDQVAAGPTTEDALRMLVELLSNGMKPTTGSALGRPPWNKRKALICTQEKYRDGIARRLVESDYQVFVPADTAQAVETMRTNQLDVVLLDVEFDMLEQGAAFVVREINVLRPPQRRRLFFVLLSSSLRTMDSHSAFLNNVNAVVNVADLDQLQRVLEIGLREFNELYKEFNVAFKLPAI
jgi:predicted Zn finger-like uncharacterized protein